MLANTQGCPGKCIGHQQYGLHQGSSQGNGVNLGHDNWVCGERGKGNNQEITVNPKMGICASEAQESQSKITSARSSLRESHKSSGVPHAAELRK